MTTTGGPQDAVPQDAVLAEPGPDQPPARPPAPPTGPALWRLLALHAGLLLALVLAATALGDDSCGERVWCFTPRAMAELALLSGGAVALLSTIGASVTVLLLARRVRRTWARVLAGVAGGGVTVVLVVAGFLAR